MHIACISIKITVSELKQPWSVLLQSKNSEIFRAGTAIMRAQNHWSLLKITEHCLTHENIWTLLKMSENRRRSMKISGHLWKCLNIAEHLWKSLNITENVWELLWTSMKISGHLWKGLNIAGQLGKSLLVSENVWNSLKTTISTLKRSENLCWRTSLPIGLRPMFCRLFMNYI